MTYTPNRAAERAAVSGFASNRFAAETIPPQFAAIRCRSNFCFKINVEPTEPLDQGFGEAKFQEWRQNQKPRNMPAAGSIQSAVARTCGRTDEPPEYE